MLVALLPMSWLGVFWGGFGCEIVEGVAGNGCEGFCYSVLPPLSLCVSITYITNKKIDRRRVLLSSILREGLV
jgi:hypothetical protein